MKTIAIVLLFEVAAVVFGAAGRKQFGICTTDDDCPSGTVCSFPGLRSENATAKICKVADEPVNCGSPAAPVNGYACTPYGTDSGSVAIVGCLEGYDLDGATEITCLESGEWDGSTQCIELAIPSCGGVLEDGDVFTSPNYPGEYGYHPQCIWSMAVPDGYSVTLSFQAFELEDYDCYLDYLEVSTCDGVFDVYCGTTLPANITATDYLRVQLTTDYYDSFTGFSATVNLDNAYFRYVDINFSNGLVTANLPASFSVRLDRTDPHNNGNIE